VDSPNTHKLLAVAAGTLLSLGSASQAHPLPVPGLDQRIASACAAAPASVRRAIEQALPLPVGQARDALHEIDALSDDSELCVANAEFEKLVGEQPLHQFSTLSALTLLVRRYSSVAGAGEAAELLRAAAEIIRETTPKLA
jgi:hypothetical protein